jgi:hypothetical protein
VAKIDDTLDDILEAMEEYAHQSVMKTLEILFKMRKKFKQTK